MAKTINLFCEAIKSEVVITSKTDITDAQIASVISQLTSTGTIDFLDDNVTVKVKEIGSNAVESEVEAVVVSEPEVTTKAK